MKSILVLMACFTLGASCASAPTTTTRGSAMLVVWSRSGLLYVDPSPDSDAPAWVNRQLVTPEGFLRSNPAGGCEWRRGGQES